MNVLLQNLIKLQSLEFDEIEENLDEKAAAELRAKIPAPILGHYDRLVARGKKAVALVRDQVCTGCHMRIPIGVVNTLRQGQDIQLCENCGRYLYLPPSDSSKPAESAEQPKSTSTAIANKPKKARRILHKVA